MVLCEDRTVEVFQTAKNWLLKVAELQSWPQDVAEGRVPQDWKERLAPVFPDIYCLGLWKMDYENEPWQVVTVGRNVEERWRAAAVGLAAQISGWCGRCKEPAINAALTEAGWIPSEELWHFYDLKGEGFWQNLSQWQETTAQPRLPVTDVSTIKKMQKQCLKDIRMTCQPALHRELRARGGYAEIDLTCSCRPWQSILAGHAMRQEIIGQGVQRFAIASDERKLDPHQENAPLVFCRVEQVNGATTTFSDLERTEETFRQFCLPKDEYLAFRMASEWKVEGRWQAYAHGVFKNLIKDFKDSVWGAGMCTRVGS